MKRIEIGGEFREDERNDIKISFYLVNCFRLVYFVDLQIVIYKETLVLFLFLILAALIIYGRNYVSRCLQLFYFGDLRLHAFDVARVIFRGLPGCRS